MNCFFIVILIFILPAPPLLLGRFRCGFEIQRRAVHTVSQSGGRGTIFEDVAQMGFAAAAVNFGPRVNHLVVGFGCHRLGVDRLIEAGPAGSRFILRFASE